MSSTTLSPNADRAVVVVVTITVMMLADWALVSAATAQSLRSPVATLESGVERDINRYQWTLGGRLETQINKWTLQAENRFVSDALILFQNRLSFRDSNRGRILATRAIRPGIDLRLGGVSNWYSLSRVYNQRTFVGGRVTRGRSWVEPHIGYSIDSRPGVGSSPGITPARTDAGPSIGFASRVLLDDQNTYNADIRAGGSYDKISPRRAHRLYSIGNTVARFDNTQLTGNVTLVTTRRDAYQAASFLNRDNVVSEAIEATTSDTIAVTTSISAPVYGPLRVSGTVAFGSNGRSVRNPNPSEETLFFETDFSRRDIEGTFNLEFKKAGIESRLTLHGGVEEEQRTLSNRERLPDIQATQKANLLRQADFDRGYYALSAYTRAELSRRLILTGDATINLLRHDTPDLNPDDRDERFSRGQVGLRTIVSEYLSLDLQVFATQYETVYLKAVRSAENNVQRSLRLRPSFNWTPSRSTTLRFGSEIRATYTVDDFVLGGRRPRDQSARELEYEIDGEHDLGDDVRLLFSGQQSELRLGRFFEDSFSEIPFDTLQTTAGWVRMRVGRTAQAEIGLRVFQRRDFNQSTRVRYNRVDGDGNPIVDANGDPVVGSIVRQGRERILQAGPTTAITWPVQPGATLRLEGWLTFQRVSRKLYGTVPEAERNVILRAAKRGTRTTIPNLALTMSWAF